MVSSIIAGNPVNGHDLSVVVGWGIGNKTLWVRIGGWVSSRALRVLLTYFVYAIEDMDG